MNNKLTNEEIAKVFAMYLHAQVEFDDRIGNIHQYYLPAGKWEVDKMWFVSLEDDNDKEMSCSVAADKVKLLLAPLSNITDEHAIEVAKICGEPFLHIVNASTVLLHIICASTMNKSRTDRSIWMQKDGTIELFTNTGDWGGATTKAVNSFAIYQYLISKGYDVPMFFGIDHWANGKTAIDLGIAIESSITVK